LLIVFRSFMNVPNSVLWRMTIILKANKVNLLVSSVLFVFWYNSPNVSDTPRTYVYMYSYTYISSHPATYMQREVYSPFTRRLLFHFSSRKPCIFADVCKIFAVVHELHLGWGN
jgi:hypothetical protein